MLHDEVGLRTVQSFLARGRDAPVKGLNATPTSGLAFVSTKLLFSPSRRFSSWKSCVEKRQVSL